MIESQRSKARVGFGPSKRLILLLPLLVSALLAAPGFAQVLAYDLRADAATRIFGASRVSAAGDVNGDGVPDVLIARGSQLVEPTQGRVWVIFGGPDLLHVKLDDLGSSGFLIEGGSEGDYSAEAVSAGDVNGDGLDDILVGGSHVDNNGRTNSGTGYVVFGKTTTEKVELGAFDTGTQGSQGFRMDGAFERDLTGEDVTGLGDVNQDGLDDVAIGAPFTGSVYVVFGKTDPLPIDLLLFDRNLQGTAGYRIDTPSTGRSDGYALGGAGDVNGDGMPDVLVGVIPKPGSTGAAYVAFGRRSSAPIDVTSNDGQSFRMSGWYGGSATGYVVAGAGDVNGDSFADVVVGAPGLYVGSYGEAFVVFGTTAPRNLRLDQLGDRGFRIKGRIRRDAVQGEGLGQAVAGVGDVNGDGLSDIGVGAPVATYNGRPHSGAVYIIFGKRGSSTVRTKTLGSRGYRIEGAGAYHSLLYVAGPGDLSGDGVRDVLVGAPGVGGAYKSRINDPGAAYLVESPSG